MLATTSDHVMEEDSQRSQYRFMKSGRTASLLHNCFPIIAFHLIFVVLMIIVDLIFRGMGTNVQPNSFLHKLKSNFRATIFVTCFYLVFNEELLLLLLQYYNVDFSTTLNIISFLLCLVFTAHFLFMLTFLCRVVFDPNDDIRTKSSKYSMIFSGLKCQDQSKYAKYFILLKLMFRANMVLVTFYMYNSGPNYQLLPQLIFTIFMLFAYLSVRPYISMFVNLVYIVLTTLYLAIMVQSYILVNSSVLDHDQRVLNQQHLNDMLIAFMVLKIAIIIIDLLMSIGAIFRMVERFR